MSHQSENEALTPQERHEALLSEIELSNEQLEEIVGGINGATRANAMYLLKQAYAGKLDHLKGPHFKQNVDAIVHEAFEAGKQGIRIS